MTRLIIYQGFAGSVKMLKTYSEDLHEVPISDINRVYKKPVSLLNNDESLSSVHILVYINEEDEPKRQARNRNHYTLYSTDNMPGNMLMFHSLA